MTNRKNIVLCVIILLVLVSAIYLWNSEWGVYKRTELSFSHRMLIDEDEFNLYYDDFQKIADVILDNREKIEAEDDPYIYIFGGRNELKLEYGNNDTQIDLSDNEEESLERIYSTFRDGGGKPHNFHFKDEKLYIEISNDTYQLVYSIDGEKPNGFGFDSGYDYYIKKLKGNWYSVTETH